MTRAKAILRGLMSGLLLTQVAAGAHAQNPAERAAPGKGATGPSLADFVKLQHDVREQRQLIVQMMQSEQQRYEMLLKLLRVQGNSVAVLPDPPRPAATTESVDDDAAAAVISDQPPIAGRSKGPAPAGVERQRKNGSVSGRVGFNGGGDTTDVYVFIENVKAAPVRGKTIEIRQQNKQFSPRLTVVQTGTSVVFPNLDTVYHNVFSNSPRNSFDLGSSRAGDTPRAVTLTKPGVVEVFCNMHQKMSANVLVVPSSLYTKVRPDGTFRIDNVPLGTRKVVAWSPGAKSAEQEVDVTSGGAQVTFALQTDEQKAHLNKMGQAYGSYRE